MKVLNSIRRKGCWKVLYGFDDRALSGKFIILGVSPLFRLRMNSNESLPNTLTTPLYKD